MDHAAAVLVAYLIGSIDFGVLVPRILGVDIYAMGSGNPGTSNVFRVMGKKAAGLVLAGDALKGLAAAAIGALWLGEPTAFAAGFAAVVGHVWPVWHRFRGGKGVATAIGAALWLAPIFGVVLAAGWLSIVLVTKTASVASLAMVLVYVPGFALSGARGASLWWAAGSALVILARHRGNIMRLVSGREHTLEGL